MQIHLVWFRRDLRVHDLPALAEACREADRVVPLFVFDPALLRGRFRSAARTRWMLGALAALDAELTRRGGRLVTRTGDPAQVVTEVARETGASVVHVSDDVTAFARRRDDRVEAALAQDGVALRRHEGPWVADLDEVLTGDGRPYSVFSPFLRRWKAQHRRPLEDAPAEVRLPSKVRVGRMPTLAALGFEDPGPRAEEPEPGEAGGRHAAERWIDRALEGYARTRNALSVDSSRLSVHLRFGTVSPLWLEDRVLRAGAGDTFRSELAWRDFYAAVQRHFPWTARTEFQERPRDLEWVDDPGLADAWRAGRTGYPVVDAAMRQLHAMGWMHNRARMIVGSFLTKDLGQDWRIGEAHFMEHLLDGDVGSNNGGWQWIASTGTDPAPYFQRMFNPMAQQEKFDPDGTYVRRWLPELAEVPDEHLATPWTWIGFGTLDYPEPVVDHADARRRAIERYRAAGS